MSSSKLIAHDGRYKFRGGKDYVSNFTMRLLYPVEVRSQGDKTDSSGYVGVATHKDGTEKKFFCKLSSFGKVTDFLKQLNYKAPALKKFTLQINNNDLEKLLTNLADSLTTDVSDILLAASVVGKNFNRKGDPLWVLNDNVAVDRAGQIVTPEEHGLTWLGNLIEDDTIVAEDGHKCTITTPLSTVHFDILCHFLGGSLKARFWDSMTVQEAIEEMFSNDNDIMDRMWAEPPSGESTMEGSEDEKLTDDFGEKGASVNNQDEDEDIEDAKSSIEESDDVALRDRRNFLSQFYVIATSALAANYMEWQKVIGFCPLPVAYGNPGSGKTKAGNAAIACTGCYPNHFFNLFTDAFSGQVCSLTTLGMQADDPTDPAEIGKAAKRFFSDGSSGNCKGVSTPKCSPICTVNDHVLRWLLQPERQRLLERVLLIVVESRLGKKTPVEKVIWNTMFESMLQKTSSVIGEIVKIGQFLHTADGKKFLSSCTEIAGTALAGCQERITMMWAAALFCTRKMGELTTAINDKEILNHFTDVLAPFVRQNQCIEMRESNSNSPSYSKTKSEAVKEIASMLTASVDGKRSQEVQAFLHSNKKACIAVRPAILEEVFKEPGEEGNLNCAREMNHTVRRFCLGESSSKCNQRFYSPTKGAAAVKSCVMLKRTLFDAETLSKLDSACRGDQHISASSGVMVDTNEVEDTHEKDLADLQKEIGEKDKEILIYIETIEQGKKERLELKDQLKKLEEEKEDWEKEKEAFKKRIHEMENAELENQQSSNSYSTDRGSGLPFQVTSRDEEPSVNRPRVDQKKTTRSTSTKPIKQQDKDTCNKCNKKAQLTGHIRCVKCQQWQHLRCVGMTLSEAKLKKVKFICSDCK